MSDDSTVDLDGNTAPTNLLDARRYLMEIIGCEKTLSSTGKPRLTFRFQVAAGSAKGSRFIEDCYLTAAALWKIKSLASAAGVQGKIDPNDPADLADKFEGKQLYVTVGVDTWSDNDGNERESRKSTGYDSTEATVPEKSSPVQSSSQPPPQQTNGDNSDATIADIPF